MGEDASLHCSTWAYIYIPSPLVFFFALTRLCLASSSLVLLLPFKATQASHARTRAVTRMLDRSNVFAASLPGRTPPASIASPPFAPSNSPSCSPIPVCWGSSSSLPPPQQYRRVELKRVDIA